MEQTKLWCGRWLGFYLLLAVAALLLIISTGCNRKPLNPQVCWKELGDIKQLIQTGYNRSTALDSAEKMLDGLLPCKNVHKDVIALKTRVLLENHKFRECIDFAAASAGTDWRFPYQKQYYIDLAAVLERQDKGDPKGREEKIAVMEQNIVQYLHIARLASGEFESAFFDLFNLYSKYYNRDVLLAKAAEYRRAFPVKDEFIGRYME